MKSGLFFIAVIFSQVLFAQSSQCETAKTGMQFAQCLNQKVSNLLAQASLPGSRASEDIQAMRELHQLQGEAVPMNKAFRIRVLANGETEFSDGESCFPKFSPNNPAANKSFEQIFLKQANYLIDFLGFYHAAQYGRQTSLIFQIKDVRICDSEKYPDRRMSFTNGILRFGFSAKEIMSGKDLVTKWQSGDPIRAYDKGHFDRLGGLLSEDRDFYFFTRREKRMFQDPKGGVRGIIWDRIVDNLWIVLDPTGRERVTAAGLLQGEISEVVRRLKEGSQNLTPAETYRRLYQMATSGSGFSARHLNFLRSLQNDPQALQALYNAVIESMGDIGQMYRLVENAALHAPSGQQANGTSTLVDIRNIHGEVNISNQHNISVSALSSTPMVPWNEFFKPQAESCGSSASKKIKITNTTGAHSKTELEIETTACDNVTVLNSTVGSGFDQNGNIKGAKVAVATSDTVEVKTDILGKIADIVAKVNTTMLKRAALYRIIDKQLDTGTESSVKP